MEGTLLIERTTFCSMTGLPPFLPCVEGRKSKDLAFSISPGNGLTSVSNAVSLVKTQFHNSWFHWPSNLCAHHLTSEQIKVTLAFETPPLPIFSLTLFKEKKEVISKNLVRFPWTVVDMYT